MLEQFYEQNKIEVGIDEAGRGCLFGPVCVAAVIWLDEDPIQDDKDYEISLIEINTIPGMTDHSLVPMSASHINISYIELIEKILL